MVTRNTRAASAVRAAAVRPTIASDSKGGDRIDRHQQTRDHLTEAAATGWPDNTVPRNDPDFPGFYGGSYTRGDWRYLDIWSGVN